MCDLEVRSHVYCAAVVGVVMACVVGNPVEDHRPHHKGWRRSTRCCRDN